MAIKLQKDTLEIKNIQIENPLMAEYLAGLPEAHIKKSADKIEASLDKLSRYIGITERYLKTVLTEGQLSEAQILSFYQSADLEK